MKRLKASTSSKKKKRFDIMVEMMDHRMNRGGRQYQLWGVQPVEDVKVLTLIEIPELLALREEGQFKVWCAYCQCWHHHEFSDGPQRAKCCKETPYTRIGYILKVARITGRKGIAR